MRLLFATDSIRGRLTGVGRLSLTLLKELRALGHDVVPLDSEPNDLAGPGVVLPLRGPFRTARWHMTLLRRLREREAPLLVPTGYPLVLGAHPRLVVVVHDVSALRRGTYRPGKRLWFAAFWLRSLRKARRIVCISEHTRSALLELGAVDPARTAVVPCGLDPELGARLAAAGTAVPDAQRAHFLFVGTLERRKNVTRLVEAYGLARAQGVTTPLLLAGRAGHGAAEALARVTALGLSGSVRHLADVDHERLVELYAGAKAVLLPSLDEGFGLPLLEAMAARAPVLTSSVSAMPEVAGDAARLVDPTDVAAIAAGIVALDREPGLRAELVGRGVARLARFQARPLAQRYADLLAE